MQADQTVLSLRPGDEDQRRGRASGPRFDSFAFDSSDLPARRPHAFKTGGPTSALTKAEVPWSVQRGTLSGKDRVLKTVKGILNKLTMESYDLLKGPLIDSGITTADILKAVVLLIYDKAVLEPMYRPTYARLCSDLDTDFPPFPSGEPDGKEITFKRVLLSKCQEAFETRQMIAPEQDEKERMRTLGNIYLIGELWNRKMVTDRIVYHVIQELLGRDGEICSEEEIVEVVCQFLIVIGKRSSRLWVLINDKYSSRLEELTSNLRLAPRLRFMVRDAIGLIQYMCQPWIHG